MAIEIELGKAEAIEMLQGFNQRLADFPEEFTKSLVAAMNKAVYATEAEAYKILNERYFLDDPNMRGKSLRVSRASVRKLSTRLWSNYRPMTLGWWRAGVAELSSDVRGRKQPRQPVVKILRSSGARIVAGAFWAVSSRGGINLIFKRTRGLLFRRVKALYGPTPIHYLNTSDASARLEDEAIDNIEKYLNELTEKKLRKLLPSGER